MFAKKKHNFEFNLKYILVNEKTIKLKRPSDNRVLIIMVYNKLLKNLRQYCRYYITL